MRPTPIPADEERLDFAALRTRGVLLTPSIRRLLWVAIDWHDVTRDTWAAQVILSATDDPIAALRQALRLWQEQRNEVAHMDESHARYVAKKDKEAARAVLGRFEEV